MFYLHTAINNQFTHRPFESPSFSSGHCVPFPAQAYEEGQNNDADLEAALVRWGVPVDFAGFVMLDIERRMLPAGSVVTEADFADERIDWQQRDLIKTVIRRVKALRPRAKVGQRLWHIVSGWGMARTAQELRDQKAQIKATRKLNDIYVDIFKMCDFIAVSFYRNPAEMVAGEPMDYDLRDAQAMDECERVRQLAIADGGKAAVLFAVGIPFFARNGTGANLQIQTGALLEPIREAKKRGWGGGIWWGNVANELEHKWMMIARERVETAFPLFLASSKVSTIQYVKETAFGVASPAQAVPGSVDAVDPNPIHSDRQPAVESASSVESPAIISETPLAKVDGLTEG